MSKIQPFLLVFVTTIFIANSGYSQSYQTVAGIRFGGLTSGFTLKHFIAKTSALEGILAVAHKSFIVTALYEKNLQVDHSHAFKFYYGGGGHIGFFKDGGSYYYKDKKPYTHSTVWGIDCILGLEYTFKDVPVNIGMDFKPFVDFFAGNTLYFDGGLSLRYTF